MNKFWLMLANMNLVQRVLLALAGVAIVFVAMYMLNTMDGLWLLLCLPVVLVGAVFLIPLLAPFAGMSKPKAKPFFRDIDAYADQDEYRRSRDFLDDKF